MKPALQPSQRVEVLLDSAAQLFAARGYHATTMRDIATKAGMLPGSIYYHFPNKEALLVAVYEEGVLRLAAHVGKALASLEEPWQRLEAMLAAHIEMITEPTAYARVIIRIHPDDVPTAEADLARLRNDYEIILRDLVRELYLPPEIDRRLLRLFLIGAVNHVHIWHRPGKADPAGIAKELLRFFRCPAKPNQKVPNDAIS